MDSPPLENLALTEPVRDAEPFADFSPSRCLFCRCESPDTESNCTHMQKSHGLFIPDRDHLMTELEALIGYMHLVINEYHECLFCHTHRNTAEAARQHMIGKSHCKIDISDEDSEFRDFYDYGMDSEGDGEDEENLVGDESEQQVQVFGRSGTSSAKTGVVDEESIRLPSGKIISHRGTPTPRHPSRKPLAQRTDTKSGIQATVEETHATSSRSRSPQQNEPTSNATGLLRQDETRPKISSNFAMQLASLRSNDQRALAHLSLPEQRVLLSTARKQIEDSRRAEAKYRTHMDGFGNKKAVERFVNDVPGGSRKHKNRFMAA